LRIVSRKVIGQGAAGEGVFPAEAERTPHQLAVLDQPRHLAVVILIEDIRHCGPGGGGGGDCRYEREQQDTEQPA
jgi:hypothetical protein